MWRYYLLHDLQERGFTGANILKLIEIWGSLSVQGHLGSFDSY